MDLLLLRRIFAVLFNLYFFALCFSQASPTASQDLKIAEAVEANTSTAVGGEVIIDNASIHYNFTVFPGPKVESDVQVYPSWVEMEIHKDLRVIEGLTPSHEKRTVTLGLPFKFPFYGDKVDKVTISTRGFLYIGDLDDIDSHPIKSTQYIAPLKGDFILTHDSSILYADNGTAFTVRWDSVFMRGVPSLAPFSFEVTLMNDGEIIFIYKDIPIPLDDLRDYGHFVTVGLSYSYVEERVIHIFKQKVAYPYDAVEVKKSDITGGTVVLLQPLPSCLDFKSCDTCLNPNYERLKCKWCERTSRCSTGIDRYRQQWLDEKCDETGITSRSQCPSAMSNALE